jgi:outer membrane protein OmpA-like peptidoglycan-associated protein
VSKGLGIGVLALGLLGLGWWSHENHAEHIEEKVTRLATETVAGSIHGVTATVAGRDIHVTGIANGQDEADALLGALNALPARRVVTSDLTILDTASPYTIDVTKDAAALTAAGHVPTEAFRGELGALGGAEAGLTLAAGAPEGWGDLVKGGLAALAPMNSGTLSVSDAALTVSGEVNGPDEAAAVDAALAALPAGSVTKNITLLDDGTPAAWSLDYVAGAGATAAGKLPKGLDLGAIAGALGLSSIAGDVKTAVLGDAGDLGMFSALKGVMGQIETMKLAAGPDGQTLDIGVQNGVDGAALQSTLAANMPGAAISVATVTAEGENGALRVNAATGVTERLMGGYWLAVPNIEIGLAGCQSAADSVLGQSTVNFVTGSDELDASAVTVLNSLAAIMARCAEEAGLKATIGGHTDNVGDPASNLGLSQRRAIAVRLQLMSRGVPAAALLALGYGDTQPLADNSTDDGRSKNRRTTIVWSE